MFISNFQDELKMIDPNLSIKPNPPNQMFPESEKLASIQYMGQPLFAIPNHEIFDERNESYGVDVRGDGRFVIHRTRPEALAGVRAKLEQLKDPDYLDAFLGRGEYSEANLRRDAAPSPELVEEVKADVVEIKSEPVLQAGQMSEPPKSIDEKINDKPEPEKMIGTDPIVSMPQPADAEVTEEQVKALELKIPDIKEEQKKVVKSYRSKRIKAKRK